jgi:PTS system ascorbate-specific IIA component
MTQQNNSGMKFKVQILAGLNLPMLMRAVSYKDDALDALTQKTLQGGQNGILRLGGVANVETSEVQD